MVSFVSVSPKVIPGAFIARIFVQLAFDRIACARGRNRFKPPQLWGGRGDGRTSTKREKGASVEQVTREFA